MNFDVQLIPMVEPVSPRPCAEQEPALQQALPILAILSVPKKLFV
jgi:hypothetical protein